MGGRSSTEVSFAKDKTPKVFKGLRKDLAAGLGKFTNPDFQSLSQGFQAGPVAGLTGGETTALRDLPGASQSNPLAQAALNRQLDPAFLDVSNDPVLANSIAAAIRPVQQQLAEAGSQASSAFANAGHTLGQSSPFQREAGRIQDNAARAAGDISAQITGGELGRRQAVQSQAIGQANQQTAFEFQSALENLQAQGLPRLVEELGIQRGIDEFNRKQQELLQGMELALAAASPTIATDSVSKSSGGGVLSGG